MGKSFVWNTFITAFGIEGPKTRLSWKHFAARAHLAVLRTHDTIGSEAPSKKFVLKEIRLRIYTGACEALSVYAF